MQQYGATLALVDRMTAPMQAIANSMNTMINTMAEINVAGKKAFDDKQIATMQKSAQELGATVAQLDNEVSGAAIKQNKMNDEMNRGTSEAGGLERQIAGLAATYLSFKGIGALMGLSDDLQNTKTRLDMIGVSFDDVTASTKRSRADLLQTGDVIAKMGAQAGHAFANTNELIAFTETLNKTFVIAGNDPQAIESVVYNLTQAMSLGVLRGQDLNAVLSNTPQIAQYIADYLGVSIDKIRELAENGDITAGVVKNAVLQMSEEVNKAFEDMPYTWANVWTEVNTATLLAFQPILQAVSAGAQWVAENWETIEPILWGVAAAVGTLVAVYGVWTAAQWLLNVAMNANPLGIVITIIAILIGLAVAWIQKMGGIQIAWKTVVNSLLFGWDMVKYGFMTGVYYVISFLDGMKVGFQSSCIAIQNFMGDMKVGVLNILQSMVNSAIDIINGFIGTLNKIPGVSIDLVEKLTFATTATAQHEANKQARADALAEAQAELDAKTAERDEKLNQMKLSAYQDRVTRGLEIADMKANAAKEDSTVGSGAGASPNLDDLQSGVDKTANNTKRIADSMDITTEVIEYMRDLAERDTINRFTTAEVNVNLGGVSNVVNNETDLDGIVDYIARETSGALAVTAEGANF